MGVQNQRTLAVSASCLVFLALLMQTLLSILGFDLLSHKYFVCYKKTIAFILLAPFSLVVVKEHKRKKRMITIGSVDLSSTAQQILQSSNAKIIFRESNATV